MSYRKIVAHPFVRLMLCVGLSGSAPLGLYASEAVAPAAPQKKAVNADTADDTQTQEAVERAWQAARAATAEEAIEIATDEVLALINRAQGYAQDDPERFFTEVEQILTPIVDFNRFARSVMGVWYKRASAEQRSTFAESFKWSLVRTYALALTEFKDGEVRIVPARRKSSDPNRTTVTMEVLVQGKPYEVVYAMQRKDKWNLVNLVIEGINLRLNYRTQFDSAMKGSEFGRDLDRVIAAWSNVIEQEAASNGTDSSRA